MMKTSLLLSLLSVLLFSCSSREDGSSKKEEFKSILTDYYVSMAKKDTAKMAELTSRDFVMFDEGIIYNNETIVKSLESMGTFSVTVKLDSMNTHVDKNNASAYYFNELTFTINDSAHAPKKFLESATFEKETGKWKLRFLHSSARK